MDSKIINKINELLIDKKLTRKVIYENLLAENIVKPNSEKLVYDVVEYGIDQGVINPSKIKRWRKKRGKLPEVYTLEQLITLFDEVQRPKLAICMWLGFFCGLRVSEVCNLQIEDIDLNNKQIFIRDSKNTNRSKEGYGKDRIAVIPTIAINPIKEWLRIIHGGKWFLPSMQDPNKPITTKTIHQQYRQLLDGCGLSMPDTITEYRAVNYNKKKDLKKTTYKYRFHTLRHTYATYLLDKGVPIENIQKALGHNQIDTTLIYAKARDKKTKQFINEAFDMPLKLLNKKSALQREEEPQLRKENPNINAEEILKQRLAKGEIDIISYKRLMAEINPDNTLNIIVKKDAD